MWSSMPNLSSVGPLVWPPIENTHAHSHLYYIDIYWRLPLPTNVLLLGKNEHIQPCQIGMLFPLIFVPRFQDLHFKFISTFS